MTKEKMREIMERVKKTMGHEVEPFNGDLPPYMVDKLVLEIANEIEKGEQKWRL